jgi:hypothetical protein
MGRTGGGGAGGWVGGRLRGGLAAVSLSFPAGRGRAARAKAAVGLRSACARSLSPGYLAEQRLWWLTDEPAETLVHSPCLSGAR